VSVNFVPHANLDFTIVMQKQFLCFASTYIYICWHLAAL